MVRDVWFDYNTKSIIIQVYRDEKVIALEVENLPNSRWILGSPINLFTSMCEHLERSIHILNLGVVI